MAVESIPVRLADDEWHRVALTISGNQLQVFLDCKYVEHRNSNHVLLKLVVLIWSL